MGLASMEDDVQTTPKVDIVAVVLWVTLDLTAKRKLTIAAPVLVLMVSQIGTCI